MPRHKYHDSDSDDAAGVEATVVEIVLELRSQVAELTERVQMLEAELAGDAVVVVESSKGKAKGKAKAAKAKDKAKNKSKGADKGKGKGKSKGKSKGKTKHRS